MDKILLLEDDEILSDSLIELLESEGFDVVHAKDGEDALQKTFEERFDLFLFDVNVPCIDGFELLKSLRDSDDKTPTIFLTALSDIASLAKGFDIGADDYIKKPFEFDELLIRIHAILRKKYNSLKDEIKVSGFSFFIGKNELYNGKEFVSLPPYDLKLVKLFFKNLNQTLSKEFLIDELYDGREMSEGALRVHINKLRKIGLPIFTIKGIGYRLASS